jgi:hypothetical protein
MVKGLEIVRFVGFYGLGFFSDLVFHRHNTHYSHMKIEKDREGRESS